MSIFDIFRIKQLKEENENLKKAIIELGVNEYKDTLIKIEKLKQDADSEIKQKQLEANNQLAFITQTVNESNYTIYENNNTINRLNETISDLKMRNDKIEKTLTSNERKLFRCKELYKSMEYSINNYHNNNFISKLLPDQLLEAEELAPSISLKLHCLDVKSLNRAYKENEKAINNLLEQYSSRYTTKANKTIYELMVIALRAELQNILYNLKFEKLENAISQIKAISSKYLTIASNGNLTIVGTLTSFIGELEYFFIEAVKIEYNYYVKKEQAKQEQLALKEKMRVEAEEKKALEAARKKVEQEEAKYTTQIDNLNEQLKTVTDNKEIDALKARILELQAQLSDVVLKKEEISNLQNGKAGNVYIISNLGSFGENVFKIGMTRRLDPQDRVNELSNASVPFRFDVHSFIFSDDAVSLETNLHKRLTDKRINKVNLRKEFFNISIDELEKLVDEICPTAEFNRTMLAEEFRQSQSSKEGYSSSLSLFDFEEE